MKKVTLISYKDIVNNARHEESQQCTLKNLVGLMLGIVGTILLCIFLYLLFAQE